MFQNRAEEVWSRFLSRFSSGPIGVGVSVCVVELPDGPPDPVRDGR